MHKDICDLCNDIIYKGDLKCANDQVSRALLTLENFPTGLSKLQNRACISYPHKSVRSSESDERDWLHRVVDPRSVVVFADMDRINADHSQLNGVENENRPVISYLEKSSPKGAGRIRGRAGVTNYMEAELISLTVNALISCGLDASDIGIISPFWSQVQFLQEGKALCELKDQGLEISTIDKYQGRDKAVILVSFVRSN
jgi:superfamily I DNA and/or RNA helicase